MKFTAQVGKSVILKLMVSFGKIILVVFEWYFSHSQTALTRYKYYYFFTVVCRISACSCTQPASCGLEPKFCFRTVYHRQFPLHCTRDPTMEVLLDAVRYFLQFERKTFITVTFLIL